MLARVVPPSQVEAQVKVFADLCGQVPAETVLLSLEATIRQMKGMAPQGADRDVRALQVAYVCAAPTLEWWADRGRRGIDPESDARFLADCAEGLIQADADRLYAAGKVLSERLRLDRSLEYGSPGRSAGADPLARLPEPSGPGAPVPVALLPGGGAIEADFPSEGQPFWQEPREFRVRLGDGESWSLATPEGVRALLERFPLEIVPLQLGSLIHWMLAPFPWGTRLAGIGESAADLEGDPPGWFREWVEKEASFRQGERPTDMKTLEIFGAAPRDAGTGRLGRLLLRLVLPDGGTVLVSYRQGKGGVPEYDCARVERHAARYVQLSVGNLPASSVQEVQETLLRIDMPSWLDFFHLDGTLFVSERVRRLLTRAEAAGVETAPVVVQHAGYGGGAERRPYHRLDALPRYPTARRLREETGWGGFVPPVFRAEWVAPEHRPTVLHTDLLVHDRLYDRFRQEGLTGMSPEATGLEFPVYVPAEAGPG